jgi:hypothetical protein
LAADSGNAHNVEQTTRRFQWTYQHVRAQNPPVLPVTRLFRTLRYGWPLLVFAASPLAASPSARAPAELPLASVQSIFHIAKSENRNQVHYAVKVDAACKPVGPRPVYGYWRELERGPNATSALLDHEQRAYGLNDPRSITQLATSAEIRISLRGFPERPLVVQVFRAADRCVARTVVQIQGQAALLQSIYIDLGFLFSVNYALLRGVRVQDGQSVQEKLNE